MLYCLSVHSGLYNYHVLHNEVPYKWTECDSYSNINRWNVNSKNHKFDEFRFSAQPQFECLYTKP